MYVCSKYWTLCKVIVENRLIAQSRRFKKEVFHFRKLNYMADTYTALAATLFIAEEPYCISQNIYLTLIYFTPHAASSST